MALGSGTPASWCRVVRTPAEAGRRSGFSAHFPACVVVKGGYMPFIFVINAMVWVSYFTRDVVHHARVPNPNHEVNSGLNRFIILQKAGHLSESK